MQYLFELLDMLLILYFLDYKNLFKKNRKNIQKKSKFI